MTDAFFQSVTQACSGKKRLSLLPTGVEPMAFRHMTVPSDLPITSYDGRERSGSRWFDGLLGELGVSLSEYACVTN